MFSMDIFFKKILFYLQFIEFKNMEFNYMKLNSKEFFGQMDIYI